MEFRLWSIVLSLIFVVNVSIRETSAQTSTLIVSGAANVFSAGGAIAPGDGISPPSVSFAAGPGKDLTFQSVTGTVSWGGATVGPNGGSPAPAGTDGTDLNSQAGISGIQDIGNIMFLVGVFLDDSVPSGTPPPWLDFSSNQNFTDISPLIGQTFFIGDGLTGGMPKVFHVPATATRLFLGFADGAYFHGTPGLYGDNSGAITAMFTLTGCQTPTGEESTLFMWDTGSGERTQVFFNATLASNPYVDFTGRVVNEATPTVDVNPNGDTCWNFADATFGHRQQNSPDAPPKYVSVLPLGPITIGGGNLWTDQVGWDEAAVEYYLTILTLTRQRSCGTVIKQRMSMVCPNNSSQIYATNYITEQIMAAANPSQPGEIAIGRCSETEFLLANQCPATRVVRQPWFVSRGRNR
jgi:hypothetical protein